MAEGVVKATRTWAPQCPEGHGALYSLNGRLWCSANSHGGNGRHFTEAELQEAFDEMAFAGTGAVPKPARKQRSDAGKPRARALREPSPRTETVEAPKAAVKAEPKAAPKATAEGPLCKCGCGEHTKGGTFRPGHDAKYHSAQKAAAAAQ